MKGHFKTEQTKLMWVSPKTRKKLIVDSTRNRLFNEEEEYYKMEDVWIFLEHPNQDYEGSYKNKVKYIPASEAFPFTIPLWMMVNGYVWEVRRQFQPGALICELGCACGVNYFGKRFSMMGLDYSFSSLKEIDNYNVKIQADAIRLPIAAGTLDGIISSYFWEHISPLNKREMLKEFYRVLRPGGRIVMLYDVETQNQLIGSLKRRNIAEYDHLFLHGDFHIGYETMKANMEHFESGQFRVLKHFGMERTFFQSPSVYIKLSTINAWFGIYSKVMKWMLSSRYVGYFYAFYLRCLDVTIGKFLNKNKSRIALTVLEKPL